MATVFSAVADQLDGDEDQHSKYRQMVLDYIEKHRDDFEPFMEDEVPFEDYCKTMREETTWAGHVELQATSLVTRTNICIHQLKTARWHIRNFDTADTKTVHLSYHDGEHYNSVRRKDDPGLGPALPFVIEGDATPATQPPPVKGLSRQISRDLDANTVRKVMGCSGCSSETRAREVLRDVQGDADVAIEYLIAEANGDNSSSGSYESDNESLPASGDQSSSYRTSDDGDSARSVMFSTASENGGTDSTNDSRASFQSVGRNKPCPCGSKRKYKSCCGTSRTRMTLAYMSRAEESLSNKMRKQKQKVTKGFHTTEEEVPRATDMGALCI